jgi:hypothetical protein
MSLVNKTPRRTNMFRNVAVGAVAALLLGSSFYAARAGSSSDYGDGDLEGGEIAAMAIGGAAGIIIIMDVMKNKDNDDESSAAKAKSAKAVEQLRVVPSRSSLTAGDTATVEVQARYQDSSTWQNVTDVAGVRLVSGDLTRIDGSKNAFAVPYGSKVLSGPATIQAELGGRTASTTVTVN